MQKLGIPLEDIERSVKLARHDHVSTTYQLLAQQQRRDECHRAEAQRGSRSASGSGSGSVKLVPQFRDPTPAAAPA